MTSVVSGVHGNQLAMTLPVFQLKIRYHAEAVSTNLFQMLLAEQWKVCGLNHFRIDLGSLLRRSLQLKFRSEEFF